MDGMDPAARLRCALGHLAGVVRMVEAGASCRDVVAQIHAVEGALAAVARALVIREVRRLASRPDEVELPELLQALRGPVGMGEDSFTFSSGSVHPREGTLEK